MHKTEGEHVLAWNALRTFGPLLRFDPHHVPLAEDPERGVWYGASTPDAALAEAFQVDRTIDRRLKRPLPDRLVVHPSAHRPRRRRRQSRSVGDARRRHLRYVHRSPHRHPGVGTTRRRGPSHPRRPAVQQPIRRRTMPGTVRARGASDARPAETLTATDPPRPGDPHRRRGKAIRLCRRVSGSSTTNRWLNRRPGSLSCTGRAEQHLANHLGPSARPGHASQSGRQLGRGHGDTSRQNRQPGAPESACHGIAGGC